MNRYRQIWLQKKALFLLGCLVLLLFGSCASTRFSSAAPEPQKSLCGTASQPLSGLIVWRPQWRPDQKEVVEREKAAEQGIQAFFKQSPCFAPVEIRRIQVESQASAHARISELQAWVKTQSLPTRILQIEVLELGPVIQLFASPALLDGGTEVVLEIAELNPNDAQAVNSFRVHWQNGGPWVLKGVASLAEDLEATLTAALKPNPQ